MLNMPQLHVLSIVLRLQGEITRSFLGLQGPLHAWLCLRVHVMRLLPAAVPSCGG